MLGQLCSMVQLLISLNLRELVEYRFLPKLNKPRRYGG